MYIQGDNRLHMLMGNTKAGAADFDNANYVCSIISAQVDGAASANFDLFGWLLVKSIGCFSCLSALLKLPIL